MIILISVAALAAGQPAAAAMPAPMQMPAGHAMPTTHEQHAAMKEKCCCDKMGDKGHDMDAPKSQPDEHGE